MQQLVLNVGKRSAQGVRFVVCERRVFPSERERVRMRVEHHGELLRDAGKRGLLTLSGCGK